MKSYVEFAEGLIAWIICFLKNSDSGIDESNLFYLITEDGKKVFVKKLGLKREKVYYWTVLFDNNYCSFGVIIRVNYGDIDFYKLCKIYIVFETEVCDREALNQILGKVLVAANVALYW